jgi:aspartyl-tRNA(Asn)/glutamyl-tRNA(Gln) amidotransferase subunit A
MYLSDIYTIAINLAGVPAMSIPAGFVAGMPVGLQIIGNYFAEDKLLNIAHQYQQRLSNQSNGIADYRPGASGY